MNTTAPPTITAAETQVGQIVRLTPLGAKRRISVLIKCPYNGLDIYGIRATVHADGTATTRGEYHAYLIRPTETVEVIR